MPSKHTDATYAAAQSVKTLIDSNPLGRESITLLTMDIAIGRNQLQAAFKKITGRTIKRYRLEARMRAACELLIAGHMDIRMVAQKCGYRKQPKNFYRDFKDVYSVTPEEWVRKNIQSCAGKRNPDLSNDAKN